MFRGLVTAIRTLTAIPTPGRDTQHFADTIPWFPFVGGLLGGVLVFLVWGFGLLATTFNVAIWAEGIGVLLVILSALLTRGLHLDGIADWADGFWGGHERERTLAIMKDSFLGSYGVIALVMVLLAKWIAFVGIINQGQLLWILAAYLISRTIQVDLAVWFPYARKEGTASSFVQDAKKIHWLIAFVGASFVLYWILGAIGVLALLVGWVLCRLMAYWAVRRVGGITGDILGASCELIEVAILCLPSFLGL
ncbi:MAG: adenosylcobinamide-GDP ribazoletransferase [SAR324 cluster bacterium]|uniref:Adenosylcobinamide-GDP ribazoletransferase n=1 Tax=SAR324 cluster bacterium TaxID=2024889 RepID=A0A2A4T634_9DELT|nr:MAG: adenosylcobinamide-GDP ribazoletransferase [SAR324 cluster bacterium]